MVNSFSKSWAMTGWRLGWMTHPPSIGPTLAMMTQYTTSGVSTFLQHAGAAAIREGEPFVAWMRGYCETGMGIVCDALEQLPRVKLGPRPQAGMYAFFEIDGMPDSSRPPASTSSRRPASASRRATSSAPARTGSCAPASAASPRC